MNIMGVWLIAAYKGTFTSMISQGGMDRLINTLAEKNKQLDVSLFLKNTGKPGRFVALFHPEWKYILRLPPSPGQWLGRTNACRGADPFGGKWNHDFSSWHS
jgi:hypothetical protein